MKKNIVFIVILLAGIIAGASYYLFNIDDSKTVVIDDSEKPAYSNENLGLSFDYPVGPNGYVLEEITHSDASSLVKTLVLKTTEDAGKQPPTGGEGAPTVTINVFKNTKKQFPSVWVKENPQYSNISFAQGTTKEVVVAGANAVKYDATGLYDSQNYVVAHREYIYQFVGMFITKESSLFKDFEPIVKSVTFIPTPGQK